MDHDSRHDQSQASIRGVAQAGVRIANERAVMTLIATNPGASNADLARLSGLGPQTTSRILSDLEERHLIRRGQVLRGRRGQPATPVFLNPTGAYCIGVELGWRHLELVLNSMAGEILAAARHDYCFPDADFVLPTIQREVAALVEIIPAEFRDRLLGIGVAAPATLAHGTGLLGGSPEHQAAWAPIDVRARIAEDTGLRVALINDGNAACWAEIIAHPAPRPRNFAYFQIGAFIPAGIVTGEGLWEGPTGRAANLGGLVVADQSGTPTFLHNVASIRALERRLLAAGVPIPAGNPLLWDWQAIEPYAAAWIDEASYCLAQAALSIRAMVELEKAIIDGILPRPILTRVLEGVRHHLDLLPTPAVGKPVIEMGRLGITAAAVGAAELPLFREYFSRAWSIFSA